MGQKKYETLLNAETVAKMIGLSGGAASVYEARHRGAFPIRGVKMGRRIMFQESDVLAYIESCKEPAN